jgi:hypothetical protein
VTDDDVELIGGQEQRDITIVAYDRTWPARFVTERDRITAALGATATTSVRPPCRVWRPSPSSTST